MTYTPAAGLLVLLFVFAGCPDPGVAGTTDDSSSSGTTVGTDVSTTVATSEPTGGTSAGATDGSTGVTGDSESGSSGGEVCELVDDNFACGGLVHGPARTGAPRAFADVPRPSSAGEPCDPYAQDCPMGMKCNPFGDYQLGYHGFGCFEERPDPVGPGEECTNFGDLFDGVDNCQKGSYCEYDAIFMRERCVELCGCSPETPTCSDGRVCGEVGDTFKLAVCYTICNPLQPTACAEGQVCVSAANAAPHFICADKIPEANGNYQWPCVYQNGCEPGLSCESTLDVPGGCMSGSPRCCIPLCDEADPQCPDGLGCIDYFAGLGQTAPTCLEDVGVCLGQ